MGVKALKVSSVGSVPFLVTEMLHNPFNTMEAKQQTIKQSIENGLDFGNKWGQL